MRLRLTVASSRAPQREDPNRSPWALVGVILGVFGWTVESVEEAPPPDAIEALPPVRSEAEIETERQAAVAKVLGSLRDERARMQEAIRRFDEIETAVTSESLDPLPANVFALGPCSSEGGRHSLARVPGTAAGVLRCGRCRRLAVVDGPHASSAAEPVN